ncbi:TPA: hypothetical protein DEP96_01630 [Candidatus Uhrbacteria bacterium]|nr:hypothetical protein [Candidatus Uhrbacteria bacterium]
MKLNFLRVSHLWTSVAFLILAVAIPLLYLPFTIEPHELIKQTLLVLIIVLSSLTLVATIIQTRTLTLRRDWSYLLFALLIVSLLIAPGLRESPFLSLMGQAGQEYTSVLSFVMYGLLFFLGAESLKTPGQISRLLSALLIGSALISILAIPAFFGATFPPPLIGGANTFAVYLITLMTLGLGLWLLDRADAPHPILPSGFFGLIVRASILITSIISFITLLALDYSPLWFLSMIGLGALFLIAFIKPTEFKYHGRFVLPMLFFGLSLIFIFLPSPISSPFAPEIAPTQSASLAIATSTLNEHLLFGSGAGTYGFDYAAHSSPSLNSTAYWDTTFSSANSYFLTLLPTVGLIGTGLYLLICLMILAGAIIVLFHARHIANRTIIIAPITAWLVLFSAQFLVSSNITLSVTFWLLSAILASLSVKKLYTVSFDRSPRTGLAAIFLSVCVILGLFTALFVTASRYLAELSFQRAITLSQTGGNPDDVIATLDRAAILNRWNDVYYRNLAHILLQKTAIALKQPDVDQTYIQQLIGSSVNAAKRATELAPSNVANWVILGDTYKEIAPAIPESVIFELAAYQKAQVLAPSNPRYLVDVAQAHLAVADGAAIVMAGSDKDLAAQATINRASALDSALTALLSAQKLKPDYAPAGYYLAGVYERQGKLADAIAGLEAIRNSNLNDVGVGVQLALLYLKQGKNTLAQDELTRVLDISSDYADAHWYLATIFENQGDLERAIIQVEAVAAANPDNELVKTRLSRLRQGLADKLLPPPLETPTTDATTSP